MVGGRLHRDAVEGRVRAARRPGALGAAPGGGVLLPSALAVACITVVLAAVAWLRLPEMSTDDLTHDGFALVAAALFIAAGVLRAARWRVTTDPHGAYLAASLTVLGLLSLPMGHLVGQNGAGHLESPAALGAHTLGTALALGLALRALTVANDDADASWRGTVFVAATASAAALASIVVLFSVAPTRMTSGVLAHQTIEVVLAAAWVVLGLAASQRDATQPWAGRVAPLYGCLGVVELLGSLEHVQPGAWSMPATALLCSVAMVTAHSAYVDVTESVRLAALVQHSTDGLAVGLSGGADTGHKGEPVDLDVSDVVTAVAERRRSSGQVVRVRGGVGRVHAHPAELAVAVDKLLVNAETYAPGSPVTLQVLAIGARVEISVSDRGPGLSADAAERAFAPRAERPTGLGLHVARSLVVANGGELELRNRIGGATFVISLPAVRPTDAQPAHLQQVPPAGAERRRRPARDVSSHAV